MIAEFPLFLFTTLTGLSAGLYLALVCFKASGIDAKATWFATLGSLVLLGAGSLGVIGHLHHPERVLNAFSNFASSLTQEALCAIAVGLVMLADLLVTAKMKKSVKWLRVTGGVLSALFICVMAHAYFSVWGNAAWATWQTLVFFIVGDLALGVAAALATIPALLDKKLTLGVCIVAQVLSAVAILLEGLHFGSNGFSANPYYGGCVLTVATAVFVWIGLVRPRRRRALCVVAFVACFVGLAIARYAFYSTGLYVL